MQSLRVSEITAFNGGMNTVSAPYLIAPDESVDLSNIDLRKGALWSRRAPLKYADAGSPYFYEFNGVVYYYSTERFSAEYDRVWYWSDGATMHKMLPSGVTKSVGLPTPTIKLTGVANGDGPLTGSFKYTYTFYDNDLGVESAPAPLSSYIDVTDQAIQLSGFESAPIGDITHYRIYRVGGYWPYFALVDTIKVDQTTYVDSLDDTQIDGRELQTLRNGPPPLGLKYLVVMGGRMYGAVGNKLYFSALGNPDSWYIFDFLVLPDTITGIAAGSYGLIVMGRNWTYTLRGSQPYEFFVSQLSDVLGCKDHFSISYISGRAIWLSDKGVVVSDGGSVQVITDKKVAEVSGITPTSACSVNEVYYLAYKPDLVPLPDLYPSNDLYPSGVKGTSGVDQGIIEMDFKQGRGFAYQAIDVPNVSMVGKLNGSAGFIYGTANTAAFEDCDAELNCFEPIRCSSYELAYLDKFTEYQVEYFAPNYNVFPSDNLYPMDIIGSGVELVKRSMPLTYVSPLLVDGSPTTLKEYDKVRITFRGKFRLLVIFDNDTIVVNRELQSIYDSENDFEIIGIPNTQDKSYSIRFVLYGIGIVRGIQWSWQPRSLA